MRVDKAVVGCGECIPGQIPGPLATLARGVAEASGGQERPRQGQPAATQKRP